MTDTKLSKRFFNTNIPSLSIKVKNCIANSQCRGVTSFLSGTALILMLASCDTTENRQLGVVGSVEGKLGGAAADEPRATLIAQDILSAGGSAADAATALYFTLAVTYPIAASLGGGGECLAYNVEKNKIENLKFPIGFAKNGGDIGVPGNIRGFAALHARYGKLSWSGLLGPAEKYANFGESMSRAMHMAMVNAGPNVELDSRLKQLYKNENGTYKKEGSRIQQIRLSAILSNIRTNGGAFFYGGNLAKAYIEEANRVGGKLSATDLIYYKPVWQDASTFDVDVVTVGTSTSPHGKLFQDIWKQLFEGKGFLHLDSDIPLSKVTQASAKTFKPYASYNPFGNGGSTSFVTSDRDGNAVACVVGLGKPFGSGKVGEISGIVLPEPLSDTEAEFPTTPVLIINRPNKLLFYATTATGGAAGTLSSAYTALKVYAEGKTLDAAMASPRVFTMGEGLPAIYENSISQSELLEISQAHPVAIEVQKIGSVNAIHCAEGKIENCQSAADKRGYGLSLIEK